MFEVIEKLFDCSPQHTVMIVVTDLMKWTWHHKFSPGHWGRVELSRASLWKSWHVHILCTSSDFHLGFHAVLSTSSKVTSSNSSPCSSLLVIRQEIKYQYLIGGYDIQFFHSNFFSSNSLFCIPRHYWS